MDNIIYESSHTIAPRNGNRRIYLEGLDYARAGFTKGQFIEIDTSQTGVVVIRSSTTPQKHKVSGRKSSVNGASKPVIDLNFGELTKALGLEGELVATASIGRIEIKIHHEKLAQIEREERCKAELREGKLSVGSICTGIGVSVAAGHSALAAKGIEGDLKFVCDIEQKYLDVFQQKNPAMSALTKVYKSAIESLDERSLPLVSKLSFSLPCTNHSAAGKAAKGIAAAEQDQAATALFGLTRILSAANPSIVESENVVQAKDSLTYQLIRSELKRKGYNVYDIILDEENGGCLEARKRYYFVAISSGLAKDFSFEGLPTTAKIHETVADVLDDEDKLLEVTWWPNSHFDRELADKKAKGLGFSPNYIGESADKVNVIRRQYTKHQISSPFFSDGQKHRLFTPAEISRLQRVPEKLTESVTRQVAIEGLGQGVSYYHPFNLTFHYIGFLLSKFVKLVRKSQPAVNKQRFIVVPKHSCQMALFPV